jgi:hypothetical protein
MKTEVPREAVLSPEEVKTILRLCGADGVLVGGQALAFWADHFGVQRPQELEFAITADADFIGDSALAKRLGEALHWKWWVPALDDATAQTGKVTHALDDGSIKQVDLLSGVLGLTTLDVKRRAIEMDVPVIGTLRVMHPIDVLDSRIHNLDLLPAKRNRAGIAQGRLAVAMVRAFMAREIETRGERAALKLLERVAAVAAEPGAVRIFLLYGIDPLSAVPVEDFRTTSALHTKRWPQISVEVNAQREKMRRDEAQFDQQSTNKLVTKRKRY